jgi:hypothetical protein
MLDEVLYGDQEDATELADLVKNRYSRLNSNNRSYVWSRLLDLDRHNEDIGFDYRELIDWGHKDLDQVELDVNRSMWYLIRVKNDNDDTGTSGTSSEEEDEDLNEYFYEERLLKKRQQVVNIIMALLSQYPHLNYNQGFHDIVIVLLRLIQDEGSMDSDNYLYRVVESVAIKYLQDYMREDYQTLKSIMPQVIKIVRQEDYELYTSAFEKVELSPFFLTSWMTTLFSHDIHDMSIIASVFDIIISSPVHYILYYCAAYLMMIREDVLKVAQNCESIDDSGYLHSFLMKSVTTLPFDAYAIAKQADLLLKRVPVTVLVQSSPTLMRQIWRGEVSMFNEALGYDSLAPSMKFNGAGVSNWTSLECLYDNRRTISKPMIAPVTLSRYISFYIHRVRNLRNVFHLALMDLMDVLLIIDAKEWEEDLYKNDHVEGKKESVSILDHTKEYIRHVRCNLRRRSGVIKYSLGGWGAVLVAVFSIYVYWCTEHETIKK